MKTISKLFTLVLVFGGLMFYTTNASAENYNPHIQCEMEMTKMAQHIPGFRMPDCSKVCGYQHVTHVHHPEGVQITSGNYPTPSGFYLPHFSSGYYAPPPSYGHRGGYNGYVYPHTRRDAPAHPPYYDGYEPLFHT